ncbi:polyphenol oxidase family protein [Georgenia yuyongxinii]|uniref:Laccase domain-containing protein n=1 Tax=Georgenia yuyongxinii TaxID=2589797 RepID=A0A552WQH0_9MICO|nr:polyphenol oxidase family protein [Georgenia yuyongxinii]TRW44869.1 laccase domain-containing protein [Georgenia yuyongxinii]
MILWGELGPGACGGFTTRTVGNLALHVGDDPAAVRGHRDRLAATLGAPVAWMDQVHGAAVRVVGGQPGDASAPGDSVGECDGLVATSAGRPDTGAVAVGVLVADCVPVLLAAADGTVVAAAHVGREGLVRGVLGVTLARLAEHGVPADALYAAVGPSICGHCYEVPARLRDDVAAAVPGTAATTSWGTPALDLPAGVLHTLAGAGVTRVHHLALCTREDDRFYSYRRAGPAAVNRTGRFAGVVRTGGAVPVTVPEG